MPPAARSRSITVTGSMSSLRSSIAAANPEGPPPTMTGPSPIAIVSLQRSCDLGAAEKSLATAHQGTGATAQPVGVGRRDAAPQGRVDLPTGHPLAEADDPPVVGIAADQLVVLVGPGAELADVRHPQQRLGTRIGELEPGVDDRLAHPLRDPEGSGDARRADSTSADVALLGMGAQLVVAMLGRRPQPDIGCGHL